MDIVNERSTCIVAVSFRDEKNLAVTPSQAWYSLYCETTKTDILNETEITNLDQRIEIEITPEQNRIINPSNQVEIKTLTLRFLYGLGNKQGTGQLRYAVSNLRKIT